jgi:hypothetical protein
VWALWESRVLREQRRRDGQDVGAVSTTDKTDHVTRGARPDLNDVEDGTP